MTDHEFNPTGAALATNLFKIYLQNDWFKGLLLQVRNVDAVHASRPIPGGESSAAGQLGHVLYWLRLGNLRINGQVVMGDQTQSFERGRVTESEWAELKTALEAEMLRFQANIQRTEEWSEETLTIALDQLTHAAYHAGSVAQILKATRSLPASPP